MSNLQRTFQGCFLPSSDSFGHAVSEEKTFQKSTNQKQEWPVVVMFVNGSELNDQSIQRTFQGCFLPSFDSFGHAVSEEKIFQKSTNQKQELPVVAMFVNGSGRNEQSLQRTFHRCFLPSFGSFGQAVSEEKIFKNRSIRNKNCLWWPCLSMDRDEMSTLNRGPPIDAFYQWRIGFRGEDFQKSTNQKQELPVAAMFVNESGQNEHPLERTFHRCFLLRFSSFGQAVSE